MVDYLIEKTVKNVSGYKIIKDYHTYFFKRPPLFALPSLVSNIFNNSILDKQRTFPFPFVLSSVEGMAPIRTKPKRTYDGYKKQFSPEGEHTPYLIREKLLMPKKEAELFKNILNSYGKESGLYENIGIKRFGKDSASPFELTVTLGGKPLRTNTVGYGLSQVIPVVVQLLEVYEGSWLSIQQPEVHLHPKAQAALGSFLFNAAKYNEINLLVETHSDYIIDRFRIDMRENDHEEDFAQVLFFERTQNGNQVSQMVLDKLGEYPENQPKAFREFFLHEQKRILGL